MQVKQLTNLSSSIEATSKSISFTQLLAVTSLAVGIGSVIAAAPASAVSLANGDLTFGSTTLPSFFSDVNPGALDTITIQLGANTTVGSANGSLLNSPFFTAPGPYSFSVPNPVAVLNYVSNNTATGAISYSLATDLNFNFTNGVNLKIASGTVFNGSLDSTSVTLSTIGRAGSFFQNGADISSLNALSFGFNDIVGRGNGTYGITASTLPLTTNTSVPEPFTIVGTLLGGTAAIRMKKKLANAKKN